MRIGGRERIVELLSMGIDRARFESEVLCLDYGGFLADRVRASGISVDLLPRRPGFLDLPLLGRLVRHFRKHPTGIIHAHGITATIYGALAGRACGVPVIATEHGQRLDARLHDRLLHGFAARLVTQHVAVSEALKRVLKQQHLAASNLVVIPNGIEPPQAVDPHSARAALGLSRNAFVVGCVARLAPVKNHEMLLTAWPAVQRVLPDAVLLLVGDGPQRRHLEAFARRECRSESVRFLGERPDISIVFGALDVHVLTSRFEAMSVTLLEAASCGVPSVATNVGGNSEIIEHGRTGILVPPSDPSAIASALVVLGRRPDRRLELGGAASRSFRARFTVHAMVRRYEELYESIHSSRGMAASDVLEADEEDARGSAPTAARA